MKYARCNMLMACAMLLVTAGMRTAWAVDYPLGVYAGLSSAPTPADVNPGETSSAALWSTSDSPQVQSESALQSSWIGWIVDSVEYSVDGVDYSSTGPTGHAEMTAPLSANTGMNFYANSSGYWRVTCHAFYAFADIYGNTWSGDSNLVSLTFHVN